MRISAFHVHPVAINRIYTTRVASAGGNEGGKEASRYLILELQTDEGLTGIGEVSDIEQSWNAPSPKAFHDLLAPRLLGADPRKRSRVHEAVSAAMPPETHPELRALTASAVDTALLDLLGKSFGVPVHDLLGGRWRDDLQISWVAFIRDTEFLETEIEEKVRQGFRAFKLKVGEDFVQDCDRVGAMRKIAGPDAYLKVDASGAWEVEEAIENLRLLAEIGVDAVETPISAASRSIAKDRRELVDDAVDDVAEMIARVRRAVPVEVIEHVGDFSDAFTLALISHRAVDVLNVIPGQAGGIGRARRLIALAEAGGIRVLLGSTVELGPGTAASVHLGLASRAVTEASDLIGPGLLEDDVVTPRFRFHGGRLRAPQAPGLGVVLDQAKLERYRYD